MGTSCSVFDTAIFDTSWFDCITTVDFPNKIIVTSSEDVFPSLTNNNIYGPTLSKSDEISPNMENSEAILSNTSKGQYKATVTTGE